MCRFFFLPQISYINVFIFSYSCPMHYNSLLYPNITIIWTEGEVFLKSSLCSLFWASEVLTDWQTITLELGLFCTLNFFFFSLALILWGSIPMYWDHIYFLFQFISELPFLSSLPVQLCLFLLLLLVLLTYQVLFILSIYACTCNFLLGLSWLSKDS